ncbi:NUDIX hydrolase [Patescibacteria group bacterium]
MEIKDKELHRIASTAIICKDGKYLLLQRSLNKKAFPGKWTVPGGGLEVDDYIGFPKDEAGQWYKAIEKSLRREIKEETSLEVNKLNYLIDIAFVRPDGIPVIVLSYWADYGSGEIKLDNDSINYAWVTLEEAKKYDMIGGILGEIEMVDKTKKGVSSDDIEYCSKVN